VLNLGDIVSRIERDGGIMWLIELISDQVAEGLINKVGKRISVEAINICGGV